MPVTGWHWLQYLHVSISKIHATFSFYSAPQKTQTQNGVEYESWDMKQRDKEEANRELRAVTLRGLSWIQQMNSAVTEEEKGTKDGKDSKEQEHEQEAEGRDDAEYRMWEAETIHHRADRRTAGSV